MRRAVIDPGVFVSALIAPKGTPAQILEFAFAQRFELVVSPKLLEELAGVLRRERFRRYASMREVGELIAALAAAATVVQDPVDPPSVARDPADDYLVALAITARADALVSGDRDLTDLEHVGILVLTPRRLLDLLEMD